MKHTYNFRSYLLSAFAVGSFATAFAQTTCLNGRTEGFGQTPPIHVEGE